MAVISDIEIRLRADIARLQQDMTRARQAVSGATDAMRKSLLTFAAGFSLVNIAQQVVAAQREFDKLNASLITATGSAKNAGEAMKALQSFAAATPYSLQEVTKGFLQLRNLGLTPSERALTSYGNTASAMGKGLSQLVEAVADAATGEFERLKEFGIKAKQQGDQVALTFQGVTTKVGNNATDIENYLIKIGEVNFAGGMALQADTLDGAISALGDTWSQTLVAFSQSGFGDAVRSGVTQLSGALTDLQAMFRAAGKAADDEGDSINKIGPLHAFLTTTFEALTVLGINLAHILKTIGGDIGAIGAAVVSFAKGDFQAARDIIAMRIKDGQAELADVNARSAAILGAAEKSRAARAQEAADLKKSGADRLAQYKIVADGAKTLTDAQIAAAKKAAEEAKKNAAAYAQLVNSLQDRVDATGREVAGLVPLTEAEKAHIDLTRQLTAGKLKLSAAQTARARTLIDEAGANDVLIKSNKEWADLQAQLADNTKDLAAGRMSMIDAARQEAEQNERLVETFGMSEAAIIRLNAARLIEQETQRLGRALNADEIADLERVIALKERSAAAVANRAELEAAKTFWTGIEKTAHDTFVSIADGGKSAFQRLKDTAKNTFFDWLYQQTLKKWIINIGTASAGTAGVSGIANAAGMGSSGSSAMDLISVGKKIYDGFSTGFSSVGSGLGAYVTTLGNTFGSASVSAFGTGMGLTGSQASAAAAAYNSAGMSGIGSSLTAGSAVGAAAGIAGGVAGGIYGGRLISGGYSAFGGSGNSAVNTGTAIGAAVGSIVPVLGTALGALIGGVLGGTVNRLFGHKAKEIVEQGITGNFDFNGFSSGKAYAEWIQKGGVFRSDKKGTDISALDPETSKALTDGFAAIRDTTMGFANTLGVSADVINGYSKQIDLALTKDAEKNKQAITDLFTQIGDELSNKIVPGIAKFAVEGENASATLQRLTSNFQVIDGVLTTFGLTSQQVFGAVGVASLEARQRLVDLSGGIEALASQTNFFADNFLTKLEQVAPLQKQVNEQLAALGYAGITTADQFKTAVMGLAQSGALATAEGAKTYTGLLALAPAFKTVADYLAEVNAAAAEAAKSLADAAAAEKERADEAKAAALEANRQVLLDLVNGSLDVVQRAVAAQRERVTAAYEASIAAIESRIGALNTRIGEMRQLSDSLKGAIQSINSPEQAIASRMAAQSQITAALAIARASGVLPSADSLKDALSTLGQDSADQFSTFAEYQRDVARTNNELAALGALTDNQVGTAERQLALLEDQKVAAKAAYDGEMLRLDGISEKAQAQVDAINGVKTVNLSILEAIANMNLSVAAFQSGATPSNPNGGSLSVEDLYRTVLGREGEAAGIEYWKGVFGSVVDSNEYLDFVRGARPELQANQPPNVYSTPASDTITTSTMSAMQEELSKRMDAKLTRMVEATEKFATQFESVSNGGQSLLVET